jgi:SSS family solute:Na+ symporter
MVIFAALIASSLSGIEQVFQFIQEYTGLVSPGITAMFVLGIFWEKTTARAAWVAVLITLPVPLILKWIFPAMPFLDNMVVSFLVICAQMVITSLIWKEKPGKADQCHCQRYFPNSDRFYLASIGILIILILYLIFGRGAQAQELWRAQRSPSSLSRALKNRYLYHFREFRNLTKT